MTYCVALRMDQGLLFLSDTRTNAGVDNVSATRKMRTWSVPGERFITLLSAGNLATTQAVVSLLDERSKAPADRDPTILQAPTMFQVANLIGQTLREVIAAQTDQEGQASSSAVQGSAFQGSAFQGSAVPGSAFQGSAFQGSAVHSTAFNSTLIVGGQIADMEPRLFLIYPEGNFIEAQDDAPFFQIGETKYGRPILVRVFDPAMSFDEAAKLLLVSYDSTAKANLSVGPPLDLQMYAAGSLQAQPSRRIEADDPLLRSISTNWGDALNIAFKTLPDVNLF
ncbi:MAG: peptidase [Actinomycetota bacterium]